MAALVAVALGSLGLAAGACTGDEASPPPTTHIITGTASGVPDREPDLVGTITAAEEGVGIDDTIGTILVEGDVRPERGRKIIYAVTTATTITGQADGAAVRSFADLAEGELAETWAIGACAESYPEQCTLEAIRVTG